MINHIDNAVINVEVNRRATPDKEVENIALSQVKVIKVERKSAVEQEMPAQQAQSMVESVNNFLTSADSTMKFEFHEELNEYYVTIIDSKTDEVIREIPSKKLLDIHAAMREFVGLLVDRKI